MSANDGKKTLSAHIRDYSKDVKDYNGVGPWSVEGIRQRYESHSKNVSSKPAELIPTRSTDGTRTWIYPLMDQIIERIETGDRAAIELGLEFIEEDVFFAFGKILKSNTARALRRATLTATQEDRVRRRIVSMMLAGNVPHEFHEYKKLLKRVGVGALWGELDARVDRANPYVMRYYDYLNRYARGKN